MNRRAFLGSIMTALVVPVWLLTTDNYSRTWDKRAADLLATRRTKLTRNDDLFGDAPNFLSAGQQDSVARCGMEDYRASTARNPGYSTLTSKRGMPELTPEEMAAFLSGHRTPFVDLDKIQQLVADAMGVQL